MTRQLTRRRQGGRHAWADRNAAGADELTGGKPAGLTSLRFVGAAIRRRAWLAGMVVLLGLVVTAAIYVAAPPPYQASTSIFITNNPLLDPNVQMQGNVTIAQGAEVAAGAKRSLKLRQPLSSFMRTYSVTLSSDRMLVITTSAPSTAAAVRRANALAQAFLRFRMQELYIQQKAGVRALHSEIASAQAKIFVLQSAFNKIRPSESKRDMAKELEKHNAALGALVYDLNNYPVTTTSMIKGTSIMDYAAPIPPSRKHLLAIFGAAGFFASLAAGLLVVIIGALTSNRLRRRDDVARALDAPIKLSVGRVRPLWALVRPRRLTPRSRHQRRIVAHLRSAVADGGAALAVVPVDNATTVASSVASLAISCAQEGRRVVLADLSAGTPAARLLGASEPGIHEVITEGTSLTVAVPEPYDVVPVGPIRPLVPSWQHRQANKDLAAACASADLLLSTVTLDPSLGGDHLATWSTDVVVMVTAGRSLAAKIHATGEMIKLAGTKLSSAVLIDADRSDESLGAVRPSPGSQRPARL
jgi:capsular polysaccharide biosynthesis protein